MKIAILGATGHVAKCALWAFIQNRDNEFYLFSRSEKRLEEMKEYFQHARVSTFCGYSEFGQRKYNVIFNGIGVWDTPGIDSSEVFGATEFYDNMILNYQKEHPECVAIHVSSGAVYGGDFLAPIDNFSKSMIPVNFIKQGDYYSVAKLNSEVKHRANTELNIVDIRLFGFFSRFMNLKYKYLLSGIINSIRDRRPFRAISEEFYRDFIHLDDFTTMLNSIVDKKKINLAIDVRSKQPVSKSELIQYFTDKFGLQVETDNGLSISKTGIKPFYYSTCENDIYVPKFSALEAIQNEIGYFLEGGCK